MVSYKEFLPSERLKDYIKCYWVLDSGEEWVKVRNCFIPFGCIELVFQQTSVGHYLSLDDEQRVLLPRFLITPQAAKSFYIELEGKVKIYGVRFHPYSARCFFNKPIQQLNNTIWPVKHLLGDAYDQMGELLFATKEQNAFLHIFNDFFEKRIAVGYQLDYTVKQICEQLSSTCSMGSLKEIVLPNAETQQAFRLRFKNTVGLCPKFFQKLVRLNHVMYLFLHQKNNIRNLTSLALEVGYFDQAHFIKDFRLVFRAAPKDFFNEPFPLTKHFVNMQNRACILNGESFLQPTVKSVNNCFRSYTPGAVNHSTNL
jgi:AraC-like DNA-binding protein